MTTLWSRLLDLIAPRTCAVCGERLSISESSICASCLLHLPRTTFQFTPTDNAMAQLFWGLAPVERAAAMFYYEPHSEAAQLIYELKYGGRPEIGLDLGRAMATEMQMGGFFDGIDLLLPVPLSRKRQRQRGYNQSEWLARGISQATGLPVERRALHRRHFQRSQTSLTRHERQENVADMFTLRDASALKGKHVLLIDDVCTTGATLLSCCAALQAVPDLRLSVLTLAFTKS